VTSSCSSPVGSPMFNPPVRHTASLQVHPTPHFLACPASLTSVCNSPSEPRSYTSVNLTLRPPSTEPQTPIDIRSTSKLTYSTSSFNPLQGFQSQLHIQIGPGGGSVAAMRTASQPPMSSPSPPPPSLCKQVLVRTVSMPDVCVADNKVAEPPRIPTNLSLPLGEHKLLLLLTKTNACCDYCCVIFLVLMIFLCAPSCYKVPVKIKKKLHCFGLAS
jgi:hypothetical protein